MTTDRPIQVGDEVQATVRGKVEKIDSERCIINAPNHGSVLRYVPLADVERIKTRRDVLMDALNQWNVENATSLAEVIERDLDTFDADD